MRDYGKVNPQFWTGKTGKSLRGNVEAQMVALYLMTSPHANMIGVYHCPIIYIAYETGLPLEGASKGLQSLIEAGFCTYEESSEMVWVHEMARYQIADQLKPNDNRVKNVREEFAKIPQGQLAQGFAARYGSAFHLKVAGENARPSEAPSKPLRSQKQEQEQEQEQKQDLVAAADADAQPAEKTAGKRTRLPENFQPNDAGVAKATEAGLNVQAELAKFLDHHTANGSKFVDWQAAWRTWIGKAVDFRSGRGAGKAEQKPADDDWKRDPLYNGIRYEPAHIVDEYGLEGRVRDYLTKPDEYVAEMLQKPVFVELIERLNDLGIIRGKTQFVPSVTIQIAKRVLQ